MHSVVCAALSCWTPALVARFFSCSSQFLGNNFLFFRIFCFTFSSGLHLYSRLVTSLNWAPTSLPRPNAVRALSHLSLLWLITTTANKGRGKGGDVETGRWKQRQRRPRPVGVRVGVGVKVAVLESLADKVWTSNNHLRTRHAHHGMIGSAGRWRRMGRNSGSTVNWRAGHVGWSLGVFTTLLLLYLLFVWKFAHVSQFLFSRVFIFWRNVWNFSRKTRQLQKQQQTQMSGAAVSPPSHPTSSSLTPPPALRLSTPL